MRRRERSPEGVSVTCKHFQTVGPGTHLATTAAHAIHLNCPWCEIDRLREVLSKIAHTSYDRHTMCQAAWDMRHLAETALD